MLQTLFKFAWLFFFLSSHVLFLQLCRFTSISLPPVCTSHPSIYICLCLLWMLLSPSTHSAHTHTRTSSFPTLNPFTCMSLTVLPLLGWWHPRHPLPYHLNFIQTHLSILFQVTPVSLTLLFYLFLLFLIGLLLFPKWIFVLTIQHLERIFKVEFLKLLSSKWIIMHSTQLEFIK